MSKKKNAGEYKANTVKQAVDAINHHLVKFSPICGINLHDKYKFPDLWTVLHGKMKDLQEKGFGEKEGSMALTAQQHYHSKNKQRGIEGGVSQDIHLPPN
ncbi:19528_t:CDS:2 [Entrophospora sp. SA101]|nr:19528_t:CDS:2 [Entrophospora sp. SA101]